jgi:hypothetical protein
MRGADFCVRVVTVQIRIEFWDQIPYNYGQYYNTKNMSLKNDFPIQSITISVTGY